MAAQQFRIDYALKLINDFAQAKHRNIGFPHIKQADVVKGMTERMNDPRTQSQADANLCGPAAFLYCVLNEHPDYYVNYVIDLFLTGKAHIGALKVEPSLDCRYYDPPANRIAPVDWIALASLRDSENTTLTFSSIDDTAAGITMPHSLAKWFRDSGFSGVKNDTNLVHNKGRKEIEECGQELGLYRWVVLFVNDNLLYPDKQTDKSFFPNHWIVLDSAPQFSGDDISFTVYSWGKIKPIPPGGPLTVKEFSRNFYGFVSAKPTYS